MNQQQAYRDLCTIAPDMPIFMQDWYLDVVCDGAKNWNAVVLTSENRPVAALPYFLKKKWHVKHVAMPPLCKMMGPYLLPEMRTQRREMDVLKKLVNALPQGWAAFEQDCNYTFQNWLPFYWKGFRQTTRYSHGIELHNLEQVYQNIHPDYRNQKIPKATAAVRVEVVLPHQPSGENLENFFRVHRQSFDRQALPQPVGYEFLMQLDNALWQRCARAIFLAYDRETTQIHSVAYLIWDKTTAWYLLAGDDVQLRNSGAGILLAWEAMRFTRQELNLAQFDFAGSMLPNIERVRRQLGAVVRPYFRLAKEWSWAWKIGKCWFR